MTNWREFIDELYRTRNQPASFESKAEFRPPKSVPQLEQAEGNLGIRLPDELRTFLLESDGVMEWMSVGGGDWFENCALIWTVEELLKQNHRLPTGACSSDSPHKICFFGWAGCDGIAFGFPVSVDGNCSPEVVAWYPIGNRVTTIARGFKEFVAGWIQGRISV